MVHQTTTTKNWEQNYEQGTRNWSFRFNLSKEKHGYRMSNILKIASNSAVKIKAKSVFSATVSHLRRIVNEA